MLIDKRITPELKNEGPARDIIRNVQNLRKDAGLDIANRIRLSLVTDSAALRTAIDRFHDYIAGATLAVEVLGTPLKDGTIPVGVAVERRQHTVTITLARAK